MARTWRRSLDLRMRLIAVLRSVMRTRFNAETVFAIESTYLIVLGVPRDFSEGKT
jgi:hypothetical protein